MENTNKEVKKLTSNKGRIKLYVILGILAIASISYRLITMGDYGQTSILFVGLPALITALVIKYSKTPKTVYGIVFKVITIFLLMSSVILGEGIICILMAAPIFYGVSALIVFIFELSKKKDKMYSIIAIPLVFILFQPFGIKTQPTIQTVEVSKTFSHQITMDDLSKNPDLQTDYPMFFKLGFPEPIDIKGTGTNVGDIKDIRFKSTTKGIGTLSLEIIESDNTHISFKTKNDNTHINHWLTWDKMEFRLTQISENKTKITWTSSYTCDLGPQWYFEPIERYAVQLMNMHLINVYFK